MSKTKSTKFTVSVKATTKKFDLVSDIYQRKLEQLDAGFRRLCLPKTPKGQESPENFAPPPYLPLVPCGVIFAINPPTATA